MLPRKTLSVLRPKGGARDPETALWVEGSPNTVTIQASIQPLTPVEVMSLPEGRRTRASYVLFTKTLLQATQDENPDQVMIGGLAFEVLSVASWQNGIRPHYRCIVSKMEPQPA